MGLIPCYNQGMKEKTMFDALMELPAIGETDGKEKKKSVNIYLANGWVYETWECSKDVDGIPGDFMCFGNVHGFETEIGYFTLWQIHNYIVTWAEVEKDEMEA